MGFSQIGVSGVDLGAAEPGFLAWLQAGFAGTMSYMSEHGLKRLRPAELVPGTVRVITARMDYLPDATALPTEADPTPGDWRAIEWQRLGHASQATVSLYARGRDYHRVLRPRLARLGDWLQARIGPLGHRAFTDSAPVAEVELAQRSGLGWRGKHTLLLNRDAGSMFFLGELFVDLPLPVTDPITDHCGLCEACVQACPTGAIVSPYRLDARRCISYLTIEHRGESLEHDTDGWVYGCDVCQEVCPFNEPRDHQPLRARLTTEPDFQNVRSFPDLPRLRVLTDEEWDTMTRGAATRRASAAMWRRNARHAR